MQSRISNIVLRLIVLHFAISVRWIETSLSRRYDVIAEIQSLWPEIKEIRWEAIRQIKKGLVDLQAELEYRLVRTVLAEGGHMFRYHKDIEERPPKALLV
ncbi:uncharacterized protein EAE97_004774 [Botrytis byssoidea]|uniref:Prion-inhibition and propagation HeLo domain-containing protein n=1 Tax=Botrytis byssoidea TaxID=139641 RepID=A0A9P5ISL4_9HELO|nr:uncharacterized protein EAE97_004774 [Botrytis byssoidea]KAF7945736.1 hypothetical protein EAE97_004774 [Botrytis byssoidea]